MGICSIKSYCSFGVEISKIEKEGGKIVPSNSQKLCRFWICNRRLNQSGKRHLEWKLDNSILGRYLKWSLGRLANRYRGNQRNCPQRWALPHLMEYKVIKKSTRWFPDVSSSFMLWLDDFQRWAPSIYLLWLDDSQRLAPLLWYDLMICWGGHPLSI